ncbi:acetyltransferase [Pseudomonas koreensis]|uniref:acetyltransferase n=1 Tax=Pseudomonas koreensis TaxID=198620 RepID=UPI0021C94CEC|nr:acetyltransferase [Pseudomonas koreensis]MCU0072100.1 acetyltransferase [Pseudomonas koreensis]
MSLLFWCESNMRRQIVIFGSGEIAQLAHFYFSSDSEYEVVAFTVDAEYIKDPAFCGLPVIPFEDVPGKYPPEHFDFFVALGYARLNAVRKEKFLAVKALGYTLVSYISSRATVLNNGAIGENCLILENAIVQPFVSIGRNVTLWSGSHIGHHSVIGDHTFIAPHAAISGGVEVGEQCFIGINSTLRDHIKVAEKCVIGAGTLLLADAAAEGVYIGTATERSNFPSASLKGL